MRRTILLGLLVLTMTAGCGSESDKPIIPTVMKQPPGMDSEAGRKGVPPKAVKPPDGDTKSASDGG